MIAVSISRNGNLPLRPKNYGNWKRWGYKLHNC